MSVSAGSAFCTLHPCAILRSLALLDWNAQWNVRDRVGPPLFGLAAHRWFVFFLLFSFHCDEALSCAMLRLTDEFKNARAFLVAVMLALFLEG